MEGDKLSIMLSTKEMLFLYIRYGLSPQNMFGNPYKNFSVDALKEEVSAGYESLVTRGMIQLETREKWSLDSGLESMLKTLFGPEYSLLINRLRKGEETAVVLFYFRENAGMSLLFKNSRYTLSLYPDDKSLLKYLLPYLGVGRQLPPEIPPFKIPTIDLMGLLEHCWEKPHEVVEEYKKKGMEWKDSQHLVNLLAQVTSVSTIALLMRDDKSFTRKRQALFLTSVSSIVMYEGLDDITPDTMFTPVSGTVVFQKILQFARGYEHEIITGAEELANQVFN